MEKLSFEIYGKHHEKVVSLFLDMYEEMHSAGLPSTEYLRALIALRITLDHGIAQAEASINKYENKDDNWKH